MEKDLTTQNETKTMLLFAAPMMIGNILQQLYNIADTLIVGRYIGSEALASVGASFSLMVFLTSIIIGLSMGSGIVFSMLFGEKNFNALKNSLFWAFLFISIVAAVICVFSFLFLDQILILLQIPEDIMADTRSYLFIILTGIGFTFLYNYFTAFLRSIGNSVTPLICLFVSAILNILLDILFVVSFHLGIEGAAWATVISQAVSALLIIVYCAFKMSRYFPEFRHISFSPSLFKKIISYSFLTCAQQSIMNFGILMIQGLVNSFGVAAMAAFAAAVKIDSFAYMPVQDFGNAFSTFIAQNHGAKKSSRIKRGIRSAILTSMIFCIIVSVIVICFAKPLLLLFISKNETEILSIGTQYLRIEGACYCGIGLLFLLYGLYRGLGKASMSVILTVISLGTRVFLAYLLAPISFIGLAGIWWAIPIGWLLADLTGYLYYKRRKEDLLPY
jgi:putative MATE family efflux protein